MLCHLAKRYPSPFIATVVAVGACLLAPGAASPAHSQSPAPAFRQVDLTEAALLAYVSEIHEFLTSDPPRVPASFLRRDAEWLDEATRLLTWTAVHGASQAPTANIEGMVLLNMSAALHPEVDREAREGHFLRAAWAADVARNELPGLFQRRCAVAAVWFRQGRKDVPKVIEALDAALSRFGQDGPAVAAAGLGGGDGAGGEALRVTTGAIAMTAVVGCAVAATAAQGLFRARVNLVRLQVLVTEDGQPVLGLEPRDFEVTDNGVRQRIETVYAERLPLDLLFVMDRSASMAGEPLARLKGAAQELLNSLRPDDRCGLLSFSHWVSLDVDLTHDRSRMARAVEGLSADGLTSVLDALYGSLHVGLEPDRRMLVLLFSDGLDSHSWTTADDVTALARQSEAVIGAVAFKPGPARRGEESGAAPPNAPFLRSLAEDTGGEIVLATRPDEFSSAFVRLLARARSRYLISYYPQGPERAGWHEVKVRLRSGHGAVLARRGYDVHPGEVR